MKKIYFITGNKNKFEEAKAIINELEQLDIDLPEIQSIDPKEIIEAKLREALHHHSGPFIVEDVSFYLDCLSKQEDNSPGLPGPLIKWFLKTIGHEGIFKIAEKFNNFSCKAVALVGFADSENNISFFEGIVDGSVVAPRGEKRFGWDPIFQPQGQIKTFSEMTTEEKNEISHRRLALEKLKNYLTN